MAHILGVRVRCESVTEYQSYYVVRFSGANDGRPYTGDFEYEVPKRDVGVLAHLPTVGGTYTLTLGQ